MGEEGSPTRPAQFPFLQVYLTIVFVTYVYGATANANYYECQDTNKNYYSKRVMKTFIAKIFLMIKQSVLIHMSQNTPDVCEH